MRKLIAVIFIAFPLISFSQTENFWTKKNDFAGMKRERCVGLSINDIGYMGMGTDTNEMTHNDWWSYDAVADVWTQRASLPGSVRRNAIGVTVGSVAYVGLGIDSNEAGPGTPLKDIWEYNPGTNSWTQKADFPGAGGLGVYYCAAFSLDFKLYVVGGKPGPMSLSDEVWEYKPFNNSWMQLPDFPGGGRYQLSSFVINNKAYVGLGADHNTYRSEMWEYNAGNGTWTPIADFAGGDRGQAVAFSISERGFICTGKDGGLKSDLWEYNPYTDYWTARASYGGSARSGAAGFVCYGKAYVGTGDGYSGKKESMWEYTPMLVLAINDASQMNLGLYPNPVTEQLTITGCAQAEYIQIFDINGRTVYVDRINNQNEIHINCSLFAKGEYTVQITGKNNSVFTDKIEVQ